jgi:hypothetical protein
MLTSFFHKAVSMKKLVRSMAAMMTAFCGSASAQTAAHEVKAREIYARNISFRTAAGQKQMSAMVDYLVDVLQAGGVPAVDIETLDVEGETALIVRLPARNPDRKRGRPILFSAHMSRSAVSPISHPSASRCQMAQALFFDAYSRHR